MADKLNMKQMQYAGGYGSEFEDIEPKKTWRSDPIATSSTSAKHSATVPSKTTFGEHYEIEERKSHMFHFLSMNAHQRHKKLVNDYMRYYGGNMDQFKRLTANDKTDFDVIKENHRFLWDETDESQSSWEKKLAKKYYDKLFKEYCISDLSRYKENKFAMRWRIEKEVLDGKGQFVCGCKKCNETEGLQSWEVNFAYLEQGEKKNALVKLRLCPDCSYKLNYHHKKKLVKRKRKHSFKNKKRKKKKKRRSEMKSSESESSSDSDTKEDGKRKKESSNIDKDSTKEASSSKDESIWSGPAPKTTEKSRDEEFEDYLEDLFF